ncbi:hypothetical protein PNK_0678 [Candidatus Protochlamydia naegleriophila]|uniref:Uncharacterized protein n=1 Tax=Candidatus Protochlamydia naegleriophila TaxID=389348 RepID=A0A0U5EQ94_9BACT|nr:hypothetical protein [Candidatus Protochlamydia naegleriophila]CUI16304.1 hypothetical protein PNK_0678 [Candidatus Protochlamydia naegleriophila]
MDHRFTFSPVYSAWNKLGVHYSNEMIKVTPESSRWIRTVASIANVANKAVIIVAFGICTVATAAFSLLVLPYRSYKYGQMQKEGLTEDLNRFNSQERTALRKEITDYIDNQEIRRRFDQPIGVMEKDKLVYDIIGHSARSGKVYGPVALVWTEDVLKAANDANQKLVFCARDGIPPYKIAMELMQRPDYQEKYPNLVGDGKISLAYISRAVIANAASSQANTALFQRYMQQLGINPGDKALFVDIGFQGSTIPAIRQMLANAGVNDVEFRFLLSHTEQAGGSILSVDDPRRAELLELPSIQSIPFKGAGSNPATHWLEDTHQGTRKSASHLVEVDGVIYPNTGVPGRKEYTAPKGSRNFLLRKFCQKAVVKEACGMPLETLNRDEAVRKFDETLHRIVRFELPLAVSHV